LGLTQIARFAGETDPTDASMKRLAGEFDDRRPGYYRAAGPDRHVRSRAGSDTKSGAEKSNLGK
jgi:hypothetical protein